MLDRGDAMALLETADEVLGVPVTAGHRADIIQAWQRKREEDGEQLRLGAAPDTPKARSTDPPTSRKAAVHNQPRAGSQRARLLEAIVFHSNPAPGPRPRNGLTAEEASKMTGIRLNSASTRMSELLRGGWIAEQGERVTEAGEKATVYVATAKAHHRADG
jgi:hypothetical protein